MFGALSKVLRIVAETLVVGAALWVFAGVFSQPLSFAEQRLLDLRVAFLSSPPRHRSEILLVTIGERTLSLFPYRSPINRDFLASTLLTIQDKHPRAVGVDLLFDQPTEPSKDARLRNVITHYRIPLAIAYLNDGRKLTAKQRAYLDWFVPERLRGLASSRSDAIENVVRWFYAKTPLPDERAQYSLSGLLAEKIGVRVPSGLISILWRTDDQPFLTIPAEYVSFLPASAFRNKVVFVGADTPLDDRKDTPLSRITGSGSVAGLVVQAQTLATLLDNDPSPEESKWLVYGLTLISAVAGLAIPLFLTKTPWQSLFVGLCVSFAYLIVGLLFWHEFSLMLPLVYPILAMLIAELVAYLVRDRADIRIR